MPISTRPGEYLLIEADLPGRDAEVVGVMLHDPDEGRLQARMRRHWDHLPEDADAELLEALEHDLNSKADELGADALLAWMEDTLSNVIRISDRRQVLLGNFQSTLTRLYQKHVPAEARPFETHLPLYACRAAAGRFSEQQNVEEEGWIEAPEGLRLTPDMFVAEVTGRSMEPEIPDGSLCIFRGGVTGSRQGKCVLVENLDESAEGGERYTIKRYRSSKRATSGDNWEHGEIWMEPLNPEFPAWRIEEDSRIRVIAEFIRILG
jgi:hypothetical protein